MSYLILQVFILMFACLRCVNGMELDDRYLESVVGTKISVRPGRHVCTTEKVISRPVEVNETYMKPVYTPRRRECPNPMNCPQFDVSYVETTRRVYKLEKSSSFHHSCCPGWARERKMQKGCMEPICTNGCGDFGVCVKPEVCKCQNGFGGKVCDTDIDECSTREHGCQQLCQNTAGSYNCACQEGFTLSVDGKSCNFCFTCQPEYTAMMEQISSLQKQVTIEPETETAIRDLTENVTSLQVQINNLLDENNNLRASIVDLQEQYNSTRNELHYFQNITRLAAETSTSPVTTTTTTTTSTTVTPSTTVTTTKEPSDIPFDSYDLIVSLSNQIGLMEEKLALCPCFGQQP